MNGSSGVLVWWVALSAISVINVCVWIAVAATLWRGKSSMDPQVYAARRWQLLFSALFVCGCAFRSFLPRAEAQRICLYDSWISSAAIGRAVATAAELCLVAQWTLLLHQCAKAARLPWGIVLSRLLLPLIVIAELCSWYTALTTNFIGSVFEESIWTISATLMTLGFILLWPRFRGGHQRFIGVAIAFNIAYVAFMCTVDVPMYWSRWRQDQADGRPYLSLKQGWPDAQHRRIVTREWKDWRQEIPWMSLYFSAGVWISITMVRAPHFKTKSG